AQLELQRLPVPGELQAAAPAGAATLHRSHRPLPIQHADAGPRIELLIVDERLERALESASAHGHRDGILDLGARRAPAMRDSKLDFIRLKYAHAAIGGAMAAAGPES